MMDLQDSENGYGSISNLTSTPIANKTANTAIRIMELIWEIRLVICLAVCIVLVWAISLPLSYRIPVFCNYRPNPRFSSKNLFISIDNDDGVAMMIYESFVKSKHTQLDWYFHNLRLHKSLHKMSFWAPSLRHSYATARAKNLKPTARQKPHSQSIFRVPYPHNVYYGHCPREHAGKTTMEPACHGCFCRAKPSWTNNKWCVIHLVGPKACRSEPGFRFEDRSFFRARKVILYPYPESAGTK